MSRERVGCVDTIRGERTGGSFGKKSTRFVSGAVFMFVMTTAMSNTTLEFYFVD